jgi:hypothetical protein
MEDITKGLSNPEESKKKTGGAAPVVNKKAGWKAKVTTGETGKKTAGVNKLKEIVKG